MDRLTSHGEMISQVYQDGVSHSSFDRKNHNYLSGKLGKLIVTRVDEVYPGDRIKGRINAVANFEPLASPIMGEMVMKQESFFVPYHILWKNAYNMFTGKKGYNGHVPLVSPYHVYDVFLTYKLFPAEPIFSNISSYEEVGGVPTPTNALYNDVTAKLVQCYNSVKNYALNHESVDLFTPYMDTILKYVSVTGPDGTFGYNLLGKKNTAFKAEYKKLLNQQSDYTYIWQIPEYKDYVDTIAECYFKLADWLFGVSSHADYIGWPVMDNWREFFFGPVTPYHDFTSDYNAPGSSWRNNFIVVDQDDYINIGDCFSEIGLNWLPFRAAYACWYWNYRDELLETIALDPESDQFLADNPTDGEIIQLFIMRVRCWYKDTFTTALTNTGDGNLRVPIETFGGNNVSFVYYDDNSNIINTNDYESAISAGAQVVEINTGDYSYRIPMNYFYSTFLQRDDYLNSGDSYGLSLDLLDRIQRLRRFVQKKLILGYEYDDVIWSSFRVKLSNVRMRIPELLARGRDVVSVNTIVNNTNTQEQIAGDKTAVAWSEGSTSEMNYFAEEHGFYISYLTILPVQSYQGGMQRLYMKHEQFDYMWPEFAAMGMDAVYNFELAAPRGKWSRYGMTDAQATLVFGYQGRYYDLKSRMDESHGRLRTDLNFLTFSREFNSQDLPKLNYIFVHCWPKLDMFVVNDPNEDVFRADVYSAIDFERRLPVPSEFV